MISSSQTAHIQDIIVFFQIKTSTFGNSHAPLFLASIFGDVYVLSSTFVASDEYDQGDDPMFVREFRAMLEGLDEEGCAEESGRISEKKRRLSIDQVKALEKNFEVENKLEPERKVKLAKELGLQPRQVGVWFQNRRARWKTKQLERDYGVLKADYDGVKLKFEKLKHDNESLLKEIREMRSKLNEDCSKEEKPKLETPINPDGKSEVLKRNKNRGVSVFGDLKDGSSDSDSSAILNEESSAASIIHHSLGGCSSFTKSNFQITEMGDANRVYQPQFVKIEEQNYVGEESCTVFFSDEQAPTLHWYSSDQWS